MAYATGMPEIDRLLDGVSTAQVDPDTIFPRVREAIAALSKVSGDAAAADEAVYAAFSNAVWTFIASGEKGAHLNRWADLILRVRQYLRVRKSAIAERLTTLADMMERSVNAAEAAGKSKLGKHHLLILNLLLDRNGEGARSDILQETGLKESNLSHVLSKLAASRFIDRIPIGREAKIRITEEGRRLLAERREQTFAGSEAQGTPSFSWAQPDCALAFAASNEGLVRCNETFASMLETTPDRLVKTPIAALREALAAKIQYPDQTELGEISGPDGRTRRIIEREDGDRTVWFGYDVTAYRRKINELKKRERSLSKELADLRLEPAARSDPPHGYMYREVAAPYALAGMMQEMTPDVMTPVNSIAATARLLATSAQLRGPERDYLSAIITHSDHLKNVLRGVIAVADADPLVQVAEPFYPAAAAREIANNFTMSAKRHGYTIVVDPAAGHEVVADEYAFKAALQTTVAEVINAVPPGASVGIRTFTDDEGVDVELVAQHFDASKFHWWPNAFARCEAYVRCFGARVDYAGYDNGVVRTKYHWPFGQRSPK